MLCICQIVFLKMSFSMSLEFDLGIVGYVDDLLGVLDTASTNLVGLVDSG